MGELEYFKEIVRRDGLVLCMLHIREDLLLKSMTQCVLIDKVSPHKYEYKYTIPVDIMTQIYDIEKVIYERIGSIVRHEIADGFSKDIGEMFIDVFKPKCYGKKYGQFYII